LGSRVAHVLSMTYVHFCVKGEMCHLLHSQGYISLQRIASITSTISATLRRIIRTSLVVSSWLERDSFRTMNASNHTQICPFDVVDVTCFSANRATLSVTTNTVLSSSNNNVSIAVECQKDSVSVLRTLRPSDTC
jgi:hypothetical protein